MGSKNMFTDLRPSSHMIRARRGSASDPDNVIRLLSKFQQKLNTLFPEIKDDEMFDRLKRNIIIAHDVAPSHDYEDIKFNGIRMIIDHTEQYLSVADKKNKPNEVIDFFEVVKVFDVWFKFIDKHKDLTTTDASVHPEESFEYYLVMYKSFNQVALRTILGPGYHCVMKPGMRLSLAFLERGIIIVGSKTISDRMKFFSLSRKTIASTVAKVAPDMTAIEVAKLLRLLDHPLMRVPYAVIRAATSLGRIVNVKLLNPEVKTEFKVLIHDNEVKLVKNNVRESQKVKLRLLKYKESPEYRKKLLFYVHGGAFVGPKAGTLENFYIKEFAQNLKGLTILSMDHPPGPEHPFPTAIQQILDTYLWVTSGDSDVMDKIGFHPEEIVLSGDSSGACLVSSLLVILNEIRIMGGSTVITDRLLMPKSLVLLFPKTSLQFDLFPSLMTCVFDQVISMQLLMGACISYIPMMKRDENGDWSYIEDNLSVPADFLTKDDYRVIQSPILSPVRYTRMDDLSAVKLNVMALGNDPLLDESLEIARKWKGKVKLHVVDGAEHGAYLFNYFSSPGSKCVNITTNLIRDAFEDH